MYFKVHYISGVFSHMIYRNNNSRLRETVSRSRVVDDVIRAFTFNGEGHL